MSMVTSSSQTIETKIEGWDETFDQVEDVWEELEEIPRLKPYVFLARLGQQIAEFFVHLYYRFKWRSSDSSPQ